MPSEKTKELLAGLGNIANKTRITEDKHTVVSNEFGEDARGKPIYIDRLYSDLFGGIKLIQKNHKEYPGKIHKKRRLISKKSINGDNISFYSVCYVTADNRWFDNVGLPIEAPKNSLDEEVKESNVEIVRMPPSEEELAEERKIKAENAKAKEAAILASLK
jgi:hypothetical protein|tara:strand:- start:131 stop:613 length:483 start_codon:yes stop_codon:yes gene_type:complete